MVCVLHEVMSLGFMKPECLAECDAWCVQTSIAQLHTIRFKPNSTACAPLSNNRTKERGWVQDTHLCVRVKQHVQPAVTMGPFQLTRDTFMPASHIPTFASSIDVNNKPTF
jgi:hypothetical protein